MKESEFFLEVSRCFSLAENTGCNDVFRIGGVTRDIRNIGFNCVAREKYIFALGVVEGKGVFKGDKFWSAASGNEYIADTYYGDSIITTSGIGMCTINLSWQPPKPKTVMIELLLDDVAWEICQTKITLPELNKIVERRHFAYIKALENSK